MGSPQGIREQGGNHLNMILLICFILGGFSIFYHLGAQLRSSQFIFTFIFGVCLFVYLGCFFWGHTSNILGLLLYLHSGFTPDSLQKPYRMPRILLCKTCAKQLHYQLQSSFLLSATQVTDTGSCQDWGWNCPERGGLAMVGRGLSGR